MLLTRRAGTNSCEECYDPQLVECGSKRLWVSDVCWCVCVCAASESSVNSKDSIQQEILHLQGTVYLISDKFTDTVVAVAHFDVVHFAN